MHRQMTDGRLELPGAARIGVELDLDAAAQVNLGVLRIFGAHRVLALGQRQHIDAQGRADGAVQRHQRIAKAEHQARHDDKACPPAAGCPCARRRRWTRPFS